MACWHEPVFKVILGRLSTLQGKQISSRHYRVFRSQVFLVAFDLNERPSRNAMRLIASGERPRIFAACSSEAEDLANSMSRRSSLNDQGLRAITEMILSSTQRQSRQADP